jgi:uncharacterized protein (DUF4415 family)
MKKPLTDKHGEVRELTAEDFQDMRPFKEEFPKLHESWKRGRGRPKLPNPKQSITLRVDADILKWFRTRQRYQSQMNKALREWMESHS